MCVMLFEMHTMKNFPKNKSMISYSFPVKEVLSFDRGSSIIEAATEASIGIEGGCAETHCGGVEERTTNAHGPRSKKHTNRKEKIMKKLVSFILTGCLLTTMLMAALITPISAAVTAPHPAGVTLTFDDWEDPCLLPSDKYTAVATTVIGINGDPALSMVPLKQGKNNGWNAMALPFVFENGKTYVLSYDILYMEQMNTTEPQATAKLIPQVMSSNVVGHNEANAYQRGFKNLDATDNLDPTAKLGEWTHIEGSITISESEWATLETLMFYENADDGHVNNCRFAIDNLVIMEKGLFEATYPNGAPKRTDAFVNGPDVLVANFNETRAFPFRDTNETAGSPAAQVTLGGDAALKWITKDASSNVFGLYDFRIGKTYTVEFDVALDGAADATQAYSVVAMDSKTGITAGEAFTAAGIAGFTAMANEWTHVKLSLTPTAAHTYFGMKLAGDFAAETIVYIDNFKLTEDGATVAYALGSRSGTPDFSNKLLTGFEDGKAVFKSSHWYWNMTTDVVTLDNGNKVGKIASTNDGQSWDKVFAHYAFTADKTYVINIDIMGVSLANGSALGENGSIQLRAINNNWAYHDASGKYQEIANTADGSSNLQIKDGEWKHFTLEFTASSGWKYLEFISMGQNSVFYIDNLTVVEKTDCAANGHVAGVWVTDVPVSCASDGHSYVNCAVCAIKMDEKTLEKGQHVVGDDKVTVTEATCTADGSFKKVCTVCGQDTETGVIPATGHTAGEWVTEKEATCSEEGLKKCYCTVCEAEVAVQTIDKTRHIASKWIVDVEAATGVEGHQYKKCEICGVTMEEETIEALPAEPTAEIETESVAVTEDDKTIALGCDSSVSMGTFAILAVLSVGAFVRKKED